MNYDRIVILIPTFNPTDKLIYVLRLLKNSGFNNIVIVDDGSDADNKILKQMGDYKILKHEFNKGKGSALKTGFNYISNLDIDGVITIDDDLQQDIIDIKKIADCFLKEKGIYLGIRDFKNAPFIRRLANRLASKIFEFIYKKDIYDTQTGLRCFPSDMVYNLTQIKGDRFEYEMNELKYLVANNYDVKQIPIKTIYNDNRSHFQALKDSYKILMVLFKNKNF